MGTGKTEYKSKIKNEEEDVLTLTLNRINQKIRDRLSSVREEENLVAYLKSLFQDYQDMLGKCKPIESKSQWNKTVDFVHKECERILNCLRSYLNGKLHEALDIMAKILKYGNDKNNLKNNQKKRFRIRVWDPEIMYHKNKAAEIVRLFRMRQWTPGHPLYSREEMFHVPFELRHRVGSYRYSVLGNPCLYASTSVLGAWCEMGEPALEHFAVSALKVADPICLLDLTLPMENDTRSEAEIVKNWPLIMACSVRVKHREDPFKPEYVIPQLVMSTIRAIENIKMDGCIYTSTMRNHAFNVEESRWWNIALPAKNSPAIGHCAKLAEQFTITNPTCYIYGLINRELDKELEWSSLEDSSSNSPIPYKKTLFGQMETNLFEKGEFGHVQTQ